MGVLYTSTASEGVRDGSPTRGKILNRQEKRKIKHEKEQKKEKSKTERKTKMNKEK